MDFRDSLFELSSKIEKYRDKINNEEMTKTAFILPFFDLLGYDTRNPFEFQAEFTADIGDSKGEKVDYAIIENDIPIMLIEAKEISDDLSKHDKQLMRYFHATKAKIGILTNGIVYKFFTDLDEKNKMDEKPFLEVDLLDIKDRDINELKKFFKSNYDETLILNSAEELKYSNAIKKVVKDNFDNPTENFVNYLLGEVYDGIKTQKMKDKFTEITKKCMGQILNDMVRNKLEDALEQKEESQNSIEDDIEESISLIETTQEELDGYSIVKALLHEDIDNIGRVTYKDTVRYFNVLVDDNIRKWICRLYFNSDNKMIAFPEYDTSGNKTRKEIKIPLPNGINDIYKLKKELILSLNNCN